MLIGVFLNFKVRPSAQNQFLAQTVDHKVLGSVLELLDSAGDHFYGEAVNWTRDGLLELGIGDDTPLPRVAAAFRRGDLLQTAVVARVKAQEARRKKS